MFFTVLRNSSETLKSIVYRVKEGVLYLEVRNILPFNWMDIVWSVKFYLTFISLISVNNEKNL